MFDVSQRCQDNRNTYNYRCVWSSMLCNTQSTRKRWHQLIQP